MFAPAPCMQKHLAKGSRGAVPRRVCSFCMGADSEKPASRGNGSFPSAFFKESKNFNLLLNQLAFLSWWQTCDFDHLFQFRIGLLDSFWILKDWAPTICSSDSRFTNALGFIDSKAAYAMNGAGNVSPIAAEVPLRMTSCDVIPS